MLRQFRRFGTFQDFVNVGGGALRQVNETDALGHVGGAAGENNVDLKIRRNTATSREFLMIGAPDGHRTHDVELRNFLINEHFFFD